MAARERRPPTPGRTSGSTPTRRVGTLPEGIPKLALEDFSDDNDSRNLMFYGDTGAGKTGLTGQLSNCLFVAVERGSISASRARKRWYTTQPTGSKLVRVRQWQDHPQGNDFMSVYASVKGQLERGTFPFKIMVIDSATKAQQLAMRAIMEAVYARNPEKRDLDLPDKAEHQKWQNMFRRFIDDWCELPIDVIWTAQAMRREDQEGDDIVLPYIYGKDYEISSYVCAQMDVLGFMNVVEDGRRKVRRILFEPEDPYWAKDWYGAFGHHIDWAESDRSGKWTQLQTMDGMMKMIDAAPRSRAAAKRGVTAAEGRTRARRTRTTTTRKAG